jgi:predicted phosphodiesterase
LIYVCGDTHIPIDIFKLSVGNFPEQKQMTKDDYIIIAGDFGGVWNNSKEELYWRKWLNDKNFTTLFVDGNHENFELSNNHFPESRW